jgi:hypothetical protein
MAISISLGTGLREPCSPYREVVFLGAPFNSVSADMWNCNPIVTGPRELLHPAGKVLDLTYSAENREACVALLKATDAPAGGYQVTFKWYKGSSTTPLVTFSFQWAYGGPSDFYGYSYIGWAAWEINENGNYRVDISVTGNVTWSSSIAFAVAGIMGGPPEPPPEPPETSTIVEALWAIAQTMWEVYDTTAGWIWPFRLLSGPFYVLHIVFANLALLFGKFLDWVTTLGDQIQHLLSWDSIKKLILGWLPSLDEVVAWFSSWRDKIWGVVESWWEAISTTVLGWIDIVAKALEGLRVEWDHFWNTTLPWLVSFDWLGQWWAGQLPGIQSLIYSTLKTWFPFYDELASLWGEIKAFFADPLQWVYNKLDEFFERFW